MAYLTPEHPHDCTTSRLFLRYDVEESQPKPHQQRKQGKMSSAFSDASVSYYIPFFLYDMVSNKLSLPIILDPRACWEWFVCEMYIFLLGGIAELSMHMYHPLCYQPFIFFKQTVKESLSFCLICLHSLPKLHVLHGESIPVTIIHFYSIQHNYSVPHAQLKSCRMKPACGSFKMSLISLPVETAQ